MKNAGIFLQMIVYRRASTTYNKKFTLMRRLGYSIVITMLNRGN